MADQPDEQCRGIGDGFNPDEAGDEGKQPKSVEVYSGISVISASLRKCFYLSLRRQTLP